MWIEDISGSASMTDDAPDWRRMFIYEKKKALLDFASGSVFIYTGPGKEFCGYAASWSMLRFGRR